MGNAARHEFAKAQDQQAILGVACGTRVFLIALRQRWRLMNYS